MVRLTTLALIAILIFIQISSIECKTNGKKKKKGCAFNGNTLKAGENIGDTLTHEELKAYDDMCVEVVCRKVQRKSKGRKKRDAGKGKGKPKSKVRKMEGAGKGKGKKPKYAFVAEAKKYCYPTQCQECDIICTADYTPVCGNDGKTYSNACSLSVASCQNPSDNIVIAYEGKCRPCGGNGNGRCIPPHPNITECPTICTADYTPVCGNDGKIYSNACALSVASCQNPSDNIVIAYEGECRLCGGRNVNGRCLPPQPNITDPGDNKQNEGEGEGSCKDESSVCPAEWECTVEKYTDPKTGCTKCRCNSKDPQYEKFCAPVALICPMDCGIIKFVDEKTGCLACKCDPDDNDNPFVPPVAPKPTIAAGLFRDQSWPHPDGCNRCTCMNGMAACTEMGCVEENTSICTNGCSKEMVKVCGSDGITYENSCKLDFARICNGIDVVLKHPGPCEGGKGKAMMCKPCNKRMMEPVCGEDCKTYANACVLEYENCQNGTNVKKVMEGSCEGKRKQTEDKKKKMVKGQQNTMKGQKQKKQEGSAKRKAITSKKKKPNVRKGGKERKVKRPKRDIRKIKEKRELFGKDKKKGKKGRCKYNGKNVKVNKVKDLGILCTQLKCTKVGKSVVKLEMQTKPNCQC